MRRSQLPFALLPLFILSCSAPDEEAVESVPEQAAFDRTKSDDASACTTDSFALTAEEVATVELSTDCGTTWFERGGQFDRTVLMDISVRDPDPWVGRALGVCLRRLDHRRVVGLNAEHPTLAGWERDDFRYENDTPCGWFHVSENGALVPVDGGDRLDAAHVPGWYKVGITIPDAIPEGVAQVAFHFTPNVVGDAICGNGIVEQGTFHAEQCDDGNRDALDACGASCTWNPMMISEGTVEDNHTAATATSLEGFQDVRIQEVFREGEQTNWFGFQALESGELHITTEPGTSNTLLHVYQEDGTGEPLQEFDLTTCNETCRVVVEEGSHLLEFVRQAEADSDYDVHLEGPSLH